MALPTLVLEPLTELDAVNMMLLSIGQSPVNTLAITNIKDVSFAQLTLHNTAREVQSRGWWFNRERNYPLAPNVDNKIPVPPSTLDIDCEDQNEELIQRGAFMYDMKNHTFTIPRTLKYDVITFLTFTDLPQTARNYIAVRAARIFQSQSVGSEVLYRYDAQLEQEMLAPFERAHYKNVDTNILATNARTNRIYRRGR
jgi:hypothetical protein